MNQHSYLYSANSSAHPSKPVEQNPSGQPIDVALRLAREGKPLFPCGSQDAAANGKKAKSPLTKNGFKDATTDEHTIRSWWAKWPEAAIGMPTGSASGLFVLDVDKKNGCDGEASLLSLMQEHGPLPPTKRVGTPMGGFHLYFQVPDGMCIRCSAGKLGPGIDVRGDGGYVICEGSTLTDGNGSVIGRYEHINGSPDVPAMAPDWLMRKLTEQPEPAKPLPQSRSSDTSSWAMKALKDRCADVAEAQPGTRNDTLNKAAFAVGQLIGKGVLARSEAEEALTNAAQSCGLQDGETRATIASGIEAGLKKPPDRPCFVDTGARGGIDTGSWRNVQAFLDWRGITMRRNEFTNRDEIKGLEGYSYLNDDALLTLWDDAHKAGFRVRKEFLKERLLAAALENRHHPVREHFVGLKWDGKPRLDTWLQTYLGAENNEYTRAVASKTMIAAVRRTLCPGTKFDQLLILEGAQGTGKSSALAIAAIQKEWFTDCVSLTHDSKVMIEQTEGKLIVEVPELSGMRRAEIEHVKANLSRSHDRARGVWKHFASDAPRQFIMIGTTNTDHEDKTWYLKDPTGNRRFWPVATSQIDLDKLKEDMPQLWAEAVHRETQGESIMLPRELWHLAEREQNERMERDPWLDELRRAFGSLEGRILVTEVRRIISPSAERWTAGHDRRLGRAMRELGWSRVQLRLPTGRAYHYVKGDANTSLIINDAAGPPLRVTKDEDPTLRSDPLVDTTEE